VRNKIGGKDKNSCAGGEKSEVNERESKIRRKEKKRDLSGGRRKGQQEKEIKANMDKGSYKAGRRMSKAWETGTKKKRRPAVRKSQTGPGGDG